MLVDSMTEKDPENRYTIEDVLNSPALKKVKVKVSFPLLNNKVYILLIIF